MLMAVSAATMLGGLALLFCISRLVGPDFLSARISDRSNHTQPARQIGGLCIVPAALVCMLAVALWEGGETRIILHTGLAASFLLLLGAADDARDLPVLPRLLGQGLACAIALLALIAGPTWSVPGYAATGLLLGQFLFLMAAVNATNFMDGLDLMVVSGLGVPLAFSAILAVIVSANPQFALIAASGAAALAAFFWFNRPPARMFLGDNGSLPLGLMAGVVVLGVSRDVSILVAALPFSYFVLDTTITMALRIIRGENILTSHSSHAYQIARRAGRSVRWIGLRVALASSACGMLAIVAAAAERQAATYGAVLLAIAIALLLVVLLRSQRHPVQGK